MRRGGFGVSDALDVHLSARSRALLADSAELARDVLAPVAERGVPGELNRPLVALLAEHGLLGHLFGRDGDISALELCLIREGLARGCREAESAFALQGLGAFALMRSGNHETLARWLPQLASGEAIPGFAMSEPQAGSDVAAIALEARQDGDGFRLNGTKIWISNAPYADCYTVLARTRGGAGSRGLTAFFVAGDAPGLHGEPIELLSPHPIGRLHFEQVYVAREDVLGAVDGGFRVAMETLDLFRPSVGALAVGIAHVAIALTVAHATERHAFGRPLKDFQAVSHRLADIATRVAAARLLVHTAASAYDAGIRPTTQVAAMAKLLATEVAQEAVDAAIQFHGAVALERGHVLEHLYREVRAPRIYEGASEIQREIIARAMFAAEPDR